MRRGVLTGKACSSCRKKKRKCDGLTPCSNCRARQEECTYSPTRWTSKDGLRAEILEFKRREAMAGTVLDALRSPARAAPVLEQLQRGDSLSDIESTLLGGAARASSSASSSRVPYYSEHDELDVDAEGEFDDAGEGPGARDDSEMRSPSPFSRAGSTSTGVEHPQARVSLPGSSNNTGAGPGGYGGGGSQFFPRHWGEARLSPGSAPSTSPHPHQHQNQRIGPDAPRKRTAFSLAQMEQLLDLLFTSECPPLTMITREAFTADFVTGRQNRYCSWPLVCAIVAVTSRLQDGGGGGGGDASAGALKTPTNEYAASSSTSTPVLESAAVADLTGTSPSPRPAAAEAGYYGPHQGGGGGGHELSGQLYFEQGLKLITEQRHCESLADVQALGLLSLHEVCEGDHTSARILAQRCLADITAIRTRGTVEDVTFHAAAAETHAGAFCLASMLDLVTFSQPGTSRPLAWHNTSNQLQGAGGFQTPATPAQGGGDQPSLQPGQQHPVDGQHTGLSASANAASVLGSAASPAGGYQQPAASNVTPAGSKVETFSDAVVQITTLACSRMNLMGAVIDAGFVMDVYEKCLEWYNSALGMVQVGAELTISSLFLNMYYHFSLGVLFRPLLDQASLVFRKGTISPRVICAESAQAVLALAQSLDKMFSLRRPPTFVPYFVYAAGLLLLELRTGPMPHREHQHRYSQQPPQHHRGQHVPAPNALQQQQGPSQFQGPQAHVQLGQQQMRHSSDVVSGHTGTLNLGPSTAMTHDIPSTAEGVVLNYLAEMAQTHPAAAEALADLRKRLLRG